MKFELYMRELWELAGLVGSVGETDDRYRAVYIRLSEALDEAEITRLITVDEVSND